MSQILLSEINISNLTVGMKVKNYRAMCVLLDEPVKTGVFIISILSFSSVHNYFYYTTFFSGFL